ncbi:MAG: penicillin-binding protein 2 [Myxococcota bacterium]
MRDLETSTQAAFPSGRFALFGVVVSLAFAVLVARLWFLQVVRGELYAERSKSNFVQEQRVAHARGLIYDQAGRPLTDNRPSHDVMMTAAFLPDSTRHIAQLAEPLGLSTEERTALDAQLLTAVGDPESRGIEVRSRASHEVCQAVEGKALALEMLGVLVDWDTPVDEDGCRIVLLPADFPSRAAVFERLRQLVGLSAEEMEPLVQRALNKSRGLGRFKPTLLLEDVGFDAYARIRAAISLGELPGISLVESQRRRYLKGALAAHVLGYLNELTPTEYERYRDRGYHLGDLFGRRGVEAAFEDTLRGLDGTRQVVVDAKGREQGDDAALQLLGEAHDTLPVPGQGLVLSLDEELQRAAESGFLGRAGSVVAIDPATGFVLAMASFPAYDPNLVTGPKSRSVVRMLDTNEYKPWTNKAIQDHYAPGSTFKAITAVAALRAGLIHEHTTRPCPGFFRLGRSTWRCYNRSGHGPIALVKALQYSCDSYFYSLGYEMGPDKHAATGRLFGFGAKTGIGIDREIPGIMPDRKYYIDRTGYYAPGSIVNNSIGQGDVAVTPLQLAVAYAAIANGGTVYQPQLVRQVVSARGEVVEEKRPVVRSVITGEEHHLALVLEALAHVTEPGGTASGVLWRQDQPEVSEWLRTSGIRMGGKTGTAQVVRLSKNVAHLKPEEVEYWQRDHAWFVGMAPAEKPEIVVVVMTEHGGFGGSTSAPVAARVIKAYWDHVRGRGFFADRVDPEPGARERPRKDPP